MTDEEAEYAWLCKYKSCWDDERNNHDAGNKKPPVEPVVSDCTLGADTFDCLQGPGLHFLNTDEFAAARPGAWA